MSAANHFTEIRKNLIDELNALVNSYSNLEYILKISPGHIYWKNEEGVYLGCNNAQAKSFGFNASEDVIGKTDYDWLPTEEANELRRVDEDIMRTGETKAVEEISTRADGKRGIFLSRKTPWKDTKGNIIGIIGISIDVTDQKEADKLAQEKAIADRMIQTLKSLAGSLSHELRTPLAGIDLVMQSNGATIQSLMHFQEDILAGREPWPVSQEGMDNLKAALPKIKHQLKNADIIINLQLQSIHDKDVDTRLFSHHSIVNIIESALDQYPFDESQRALVHFDDESDFTFWGESHLMLNVLYNLIKNSLYFVQEAGKGEIFITFSSDDDYNYLHFKDTAQGMPPEIAANVFEKFYTKTRHGTGLGLAFCQQVMQSFKGDIVCQSKEGEYAEFILSFPKLDKQENN